MSTLQKFETEEDLAEHLLATIYDYLSEKEKLSTTQTIFVGGSEYDSNQTKFERMLNSQLFFLKTKLNEKDAAVAMWWWSVCVDGHISSLNPTEFTGRINDLACDYDDVDDEYKLLTQTFSLEKFNDDFEGEFKKMMEVVSITVGTFSDFSNNHKTIRYSSIPFRSNECHVYASCPKDSLFEFTFEDIFKKWM